jgi:hypothetical protein
MTASAFSRLFAGIRGTAVFRVLPSFRGAPRYPVFPRLFRGGLALTAHLFPYTSRLLLPLEYVVHSKPPALSLLAMCFVTSSLMSGCVLACNVSVILTYYGCFVDITVHLGTWWLPRWTIALVQYGLAYLDLAQLRSRPNGVAIRLRAKRSGVAPGGRG